MREPAFSAHFGDSLFRIIIFWLVELVINDITRTAHALYLFTHMFPMLGFRTGNTAGRKADTVPVPANTVPVPANTDPSTPRLNGKHRGYISKKSALMTMK